MTGFLRARVTACHRLVTALLVAVAGAGCSSPAQQARALIERRQFRSACALLAGTEPDGDRRELDEAKDELLRAVAAANETFLTVHALDADEFTRLLGVPPLPEVGYGERVLLLRATLDATRSRVPVELERFGVYWVQGAVSWVSPPVEPGLAQQALLGAGAVPAAGTVGPIIGGTGTSLTFHDFESLGPFAIHGFLLFHMVTLGLTLPGSFSSSPPPEGLHLSPLLRERDRPRSSRPAALQASPSALARERLQYLTRSRGCRAEPGTSCEDYWVVERTKPGQWLPGPPVIEADVMFPLPPGCFRDDHLSIPFPGNGTLVEGLRALEGRGPMRIEIPPPTRPSARKGEGT